MSTSPGNLSAVGSYDPITANAPKIGSNSMGTSSKEIQDNFMKMLITQLQNAGYQHALSIEMTPEADLDMRQELRKLRLLLDSLL